MDRSENTGVPLPPSYLVSGLFSVTFQGMRKLLKTKRVSRNQVQIKDLRPDLPNEESPVVNLKSAYGWTPRMQLYVSLRDTQDHENAEQADPSARFPHAR